MNVKPPTALPRTPTKSIDPPDRSSVYSPFGLEPESDSDSPPRRPTRSVKPQTKVLRSKSQRKSKHRVPFSEVADLNDYNTPGRKEIQEKVVHTRTTRALKMARQRQDSVQPEEADEQEKMEQGARILQRIFNERVEE